MKKLLFLPLSFLLADALAQGDFVKQTDTNNPINTFTSSGPYRGCAWIDFNNDGLVDLHAAPGFLFNNDGINGLFSAVPNPMAQATPPGYGPASCSWADYDNDGDIDCYICSYKSRLYRNDGTGILTVDSNIYATIKNYTGWSAAMGDANNDSKIDVCLVYANGFHGGTPLTPSFYLQQDAAGMLHEITGYAFTDSLAPYTVPYWSDYDLDGDQDLFIASGPAGSGGYDYCYKNLFMETGNDTLERITNALFATDLQDGQCYNFIDYDNDGDRDLCVTNYGGVPARLYRNEGGGVYISILTPFTTAAPRLANCWGDYDNDGDEDVIMTTDLQAVSYYENEGNDLFTSVAFNMTSKTGGSSVANCDFDNDGDLDAFIMGTGTAKGLYLNDGIAGTNNWINIKCNGTVSNRSATGTIVRLKATINGQSKWQLREISAMNTFMGHNDLRVHFGLGDATVIDSIVIRYLSGVTETFTNIAANAFYSNTEGNNMLDNITSVQEVPAASNAFRINPNPAKEFILLESLLKNTEQVKYTISSMDGKVVLSETLLTSDSLKINISHYEPGAYIITLRGKSMLQNLTFIKE